MKLTITNDVKQNNLLIFSSITKDIVETYILIFNKNGLYMQSMIIFIFVYVSEFTV